MVFFVCLFCFLLQAHGRPAFCTSLCPRFLSHMKARPKDFCPPYYRSSKFTQQRPSSHGKVQNTHASTAPKSQMLQGEGLLMKHLDLSLLTPLSPQACSVAKASSHQACRQLCVQLCLLNSKSILSSEDVPTAPPFWWSPGVKSLVLGDLPLLSEPSL